MKPCSAKRDFLSTIAGLSSRFWPNPWVRRIPFISETGRFGYFHSRERQSFSPASASYGLWKMQKFIRPFNIPQAPNLHQRAGTHWPGKKGQQANPNTKTNEYNPNIQANAEQGLKINPQQVYTKCDYCDNDSDIELNFEIKF